MISLQCSHKFVKPSPTLRLQTPKINHFVYTERFVLQFLFCVVSLPKLMSTSFSCLSDLEECQLSECGGEEELGGGESPLPRSSSTSDITQQLSDTLPGMYQQETFFIIPHMFHWTDPDRIDTLIVRL